LIRWRGTLYRFHPLFTLVMLFSALTGYLVEAITLFGVVFIHEMGHVAAAKGFGWNVREVQLLPFGGVAVVDELGTVPLYEELAVALSGPLQHLWMILFGLIMRAADPSSLDWWNYFIEVNVMIGLFNLLPVLPLDGGRVLQCLFGYIISYHRTLWITVWLSLVLSAFVISFAIYGLFINRLPLNLLAIGLFLLMSNWYAYRQLPFFHFRFLMSRENRVSRLLMSGTLAQPIVVARQQKITDILKLFMREKYHLIYVMNEKGRIQAVLPEHLLVSGYLDGKKPGSAVSELFM
jgi:stage IV sporulation protein FB